jgi:hypothetical protein
MRRWVQSTTTREHWAAGGLFLALAVAFMHRTLLPPPGQILGGYDMRGYYHIVAEVLRESVRSGRLPFWSANLFNGIPFLADPQVSAFYPPAWLMVLLPANAGWSWYMVLHICLAGSGLYALARYLGSRWTPAVAAGVAFAFSGLLAGRLWAGHPTVYATLSWTPWLVLALFWSVGRRHRWAAVLAGGAFGLALLTGHLPSFLYIGLIWVAFVLYLLTTRPDGRRLVIRQATIMVLAGLGLAAVQLVPFMQFSLTSQRLAVDYEFASAYSLPPAHLITAVIPEFFGEPLRVGYWSVPTFEEMAFYPGLLVVIGLVLALRRPDRLTWWLVGMMALGMWLALGRYGVLFTLFYDLVPPFRVNRAPARAAFLYLFGMAVLLPLALGRWRSAPADERREALGRLLRRTLFVACVLGVAALAATGAVFMSVHPTDTSGRLWHQIGGYSLALVLLLLGGGLIWLYLAPGAENGRRQMVVGAALITLAIADSWIFAFKYARLEPAGPDAIWHDARAIVGQTEERVLPWGLPIFTQNGALQVGLNSVFGYVDLEPGNHIALASSVADPRSTAYDVLGAAYVLASTPLEQFTQGDSPLTLVEQRGQAWVYRRARPLPVARLVSGYEVLADRDAAIARVHHPAFDPQTTAILAEEPPCRPGGEATADGQATIEEWRDGYWRIRTESAQAALLILAETSYPGWQVSVDGQPAQPLTAYTAVRGVCVPAGSHEVIWQFRPWIYLVGLGVTVVALLALGAAAIAWRAARRAGLDGS